MNETRRWRYSAALVILIFVLAGGAWYVMISMPGASFQGPPEPLTPSQQDLKKHLRKHVETLGGEIGERNLWHPDKYDQARMYIQTELQDMGYRVNQVSYELENQRFHNLEVQRQGTSRPGDLLIVGAHYDTVRGSPGANDNGTGVALVLELARRFRHRTPDRTVRFLTFANEEPPFFKSSDMGSYHYAKKIKEQNLNVKAMWSLETLGYYSQDPGSQHYPPLVGWFYPERGNFVGFVGNLSSRSLVRTTVGEFRKRAQIPSEGGALPALVPGVDWSDHWSFWQFGFPAMMVTDTAPFRYPHYHGPGDTPDKVDYEALTRILTGVAHVVESFASIR